MNTILHKFKKVTLGIVAIAVSVGILGFFYQYSQQSKADSTQIDFKFSKTELVFTPDTPQQIVDINIFSDGNKISGATVLIEFPPNVVQLGSISYPEACNSLPSAARWNIDNTTGTAYAMKYNSDTDNAQLPPAADDDVFFCFARLEFIGVDNNNEDPASGTITFHADPIDNTAWEVVGPGTYSPNYANQEVAITVANGTYPTAIPIPTATPTPSVNPSITTTITPSPSVNPSISPSVQPTPIITDPLTLSVGKDSVMKFSICNVDNSTILSTHAILYGTSIDSSTTSLVWSPNDCSGFQTSISVLTSSLKRVQLNASSVVLRLTSNDAMWEVFEYGWRKISQTTPGTGTSTNITFDIRTQGLTTAAKNVNEIPVKVTFLQEETVVDTRTISMSKNGDGSWTGTSGYDVLLANTDYTLLIKGPKHLQKKICENKPSESIAGQYSCADGAIRIVAGDNKLELKGITLLAGDLPLQNGIVDAVDIAYIRGNLGKTDAEIVSRADLNYDGIVDSQDYGIIINALGFKYDEEE